MPLLSICIPSYNRVEQLSRLLLSVSIQSFKDFEVIVTDDSPNDSVKSLCESFENSIPLMYFKNEKALGTPENWNEGIRRATGQWIKLMHDDDWFLNNDSLAIFADAIKGGEGKLIFSSYKNIRSKESEGVSVNLSSFRKFLLNRNPVSLLSKNCIGPPSVTLFERVPFMEFDKKLKWLVDMEFYIRQLQYKSFVYINQPLIGIGIHDLQVTACSSLNPEVEIPEHIYLINKLGIKALDNIPFYDAYWRLFRNLGIYELSAIRHFEPNLPFPEKLASLIRIQRNIPLWVLKIGPFSKVFMLISYFKSRLIK